MGQRLFGVSFWGHCLVVEARKIRPDFIEAFQQKALCEKALKMPDDAEESLAEVRRLESLHPGAAPKSMPAAAGSAFLQHTGPNRLKHIVSSGSLIVPRGTPRKNDTPPYDEWQGHIHIVPKSRSHTASRGCRLRQMSARCLPDVPR